MKLFSLFLFFIIFSLNTYANECIHKHYIVSDFDDTIKVYKSKNILSKLDYVLWKTQIYAGMNVLINEMSKESVNENTVSCDNDLFTVVSGSNKLFRASIKHLLNERNFPNRNIILKSFGLSTLEYKIDAIEQIYADKNIPLILIGDDTSHDFEVYNEISQKHPGSVLATYIHKIKNQDIFPEQKNYITAFDIALYEYLDGRLNEDAVIQVGTSVLESKDKYIIPKYGYCPSKFVKFNESNLPQSIQNIKDELEKRINSICMNRNIFFKK